jgi:hypothetical protein
MKLASTIFSTRPRSAVVPQLILNALNAVSDFVGI